MNRRKRLTFWGKDEDDDLLVRNAMAGKKTATASPAAEYGIPYSDYGDHNYETGDLVEAYDGKKRLRCLFKITDVHKIKFGSVPERVWRGENFQSAKEFQEVHIRCMPNYQLHDEFEFVIVHFEVVEIFLREAPGA